MSSLSATWNKEEGLGSESTRLHSDTELVADNFAETTKKPTSRRRRLIHRIVIATLFVLILVGVVLTGVLFNKSVKKTESKHAVNFSADAELKPAPNAPDPGPNALAVGVTIQLNSFDGSTLSFDMLAFLGLADSEDALNQTNQVCVFAEDPQGLIAPLSLPINYGDSKSNTQSSSYNTSAGGSVSHFPFDVYTGALVMSAQEIINNTDQTVLPCDQEFSIDPNVVVNRLPLFFQIGQDLDAFSAHTTLLQVDENDPQSLSFGNSTVVLSVTIKRREVVQFFAVLMFVATWLLTIGVILATALVLVSGGESRFDIIAACTGLLFALPSLRQATPGIPTTPTVSDAVGYFWNIALLALSTFALMVHAIISMARAEKSQGKGGKED